MGVLCGIAVHWYDEAGANRLVAEWPDDERYGLIVVDNGSRAPLGRGARARVLRPGRNLGFGGAINLGLRHTTARFVLMLNTDVAIMPGTLDALVEGFERYPEAAAIVPRLEGEDGGSQYRWQLRKIPSPLRLLTHALLVDFGGGPRCEPPAGARVEQPAAAALACRREVLVGLGGFDEGFHPAWFEDVDLARRFRAASHSFRYCPEARMIHRQGASVGVLGYGAFLSIYHANLRRYLAKHHGRTWEAAARLLLIPSALVRALLVPLRCPRRASGRREAIAGLGRLAVEAARGRRVAPPPPGLG